MLKPEDIQEILRVFADSDLEELRLEIGDTRLHASKGTGLPLPESRTAPSPPASSPPAAPSAQPSSAAATPAAPTPPAAPAATQPASTEGLHELTSPLLGVFYRRPSPDQPPYVEVGSTVSADDSVCIVDVMKMFTQIPAGIAGKVVEICVEDGQLVEHGQVLMRIEPQ